MNSRFSTASAPPKSHRLGVSLSPERSDEKSDERAPRRGLAANGDPKSVSIASVSAPASVFSRPNRPPRSPRPNRSPSSPSSLSWSNTGATADASAATPPGPSTLSRRSSTCSAVLKDQRGVTNPRSDARPHGPVTDSSASSSSTPATPADPFRRGLMASASAAAPSGPIVAPPRCNSRKRGLCVHRPSGSRRGLSASATCAAPPSPRPVLLRFKTRRLLGNVHTLFLRSPEPDPVNAAAVWTCAVWTPSHRLGRSTSARARPPSSPSSTLARWMVESAAANAHLPSGFCLGARDSERASGPSCDRHELALACRCLNVGLYCHEPSRRRTGANARAIRARPTSPSWLRPTLSERNVGWNAKSSLGCARGASASASARAPSAPRRLWNSDKCVIPP